MWANAFREQRTHKRNVRSIWSDGLILKAHWEMWEISKYCVWAGLTSLLLSVVIVVHWKVLKNQIIWEGSQGLGWEEWLLLKTEVLAYSCTTQTTSKSPEVRMVKVNNSKVFYRFLGAYWPQGMFKMLSNLLCKVFMQNDLHSVTGCDLCSCSYLNSFHVCRAWYGYLVHFTKPT